MRFSGPETEGLPTLTGDATGAVAVACGEISAVRTRLVGGFPACANAGDEFVNAPTARRQANAAPNNRALKEDWSRADMAFPFWDGSHRPFVSSYEFAFRASVRWL